MTSKKELEKRVTELEEENKFLTGEIEKMDETIQGLRKEKDFLDDTVKVQQENIDEQVNVIGDLREAFFSKQTMFLMVDTTQYPTKEGKDQALDYVRERMDAELKRIGIDANAITLPEVVKTIEFHDTKRVK